MAVVELAAAAAVNHGGKLATIQRGRDVLASKNREHRARKLNLIAFRCIKVIQGVDAQIRKGCDSRKGKAIALLIPSLIPSLILSLILSPMLRKARSLCGSLDDAKHNMVMYRDTCRILSIPIAN